jgi:hypothetical protein
LLRRSWQINPVTRVKNSRKIFLRPRITRFAEIGKRLDRIN